MSWAFHDFAELRFTSQDIRRIPAVHAAFLVSSSFAVNELNILLRLLLLSLNASKHAGREEAEQTAVYTSSLVAYRLLSAKIIEFLKLYRDYEKKAQRKEGAHGKRFIENCNEQMDRIAENEIYEFAGKLRDKITSHYIISEIEKIVEMTPEKQTYTMWLNQKAGNTFYAVGEEIAMMGMLNAEGNARDIIEKWDSWVVSSQKAIVRAHSDAIIGMLEEFFPNKSARGRRIVVDDKLVTELTDSCLPIFWNFRNYGE